MEKNGKTRRRVSCRAASRGALSSRYPCLSVSDFELLRAFASASLAARAGACGPTRASFSFPRVLTRVSALFHVSARRLSAGFPGCLRAPARFVCQYPFVCPHRPACLRGGVATWPRVVGFTCVRAPVYLFLPPCPVRLCVSTFSRICA